MSTPQTAYLVSMMQPKSFKNGSRRREQYFDTVTVLLSTLMNTSLVNLMRRTSFIWLTSTT